ncbi:uncharacterized protein LOC122505790 [Leptopilina heterotoma]|uniref:uncharacterized protein LOC122505790 n=1 Tax=Leptopilina heterotoma TaxID=63436 RepID=UPI001CAA32C9|nr:uncharacterized protein LOC122505790 [Leptopilina heterotoma]
MYKSKIVNTIQAIISNFPDGLQIEKLDDEYEMWTQKSIPYLKMGFHSLYDLIRACPEIKTTKNKQNETVYTIVPINNSSSKDEFSRFEKKNTRSERRFMPYRRPRTSVPRRSGTPVNFDSSAKDSSRSNSSFRPSSASSIRTTSSYKSKNSRGPQITINPQKKMDNVNEPILNGQQLIGDDFFLQIAIKTLDSKLYRKSENAPLYSGLCVSGQSIRACTRRLKTIETISNKVTIMLGSVDIYEGRDLKQMKEDYLLLLDTLEEKFNLPKSSITIGTIAPLANVNFRTQYDEYSTLVCFNNWLRQLVDNRCDELGQRKFYYKIIDFHKELSTDIEGVNYDYFQNDGRNVSGTRHAYVLLNQVGRSKIVSLFFIKALENKNYFSTKKSKIYDEFSEELNWL